MNTNVDVSSFITFWICPKWNSYAFWTNLNAALPFCKFTLRGNSR